MRTAGAGRIWIWGLLVAAAGMPLAAFILYSGRGETFFFDEWIFLLGRQGHQPNTFLDAYNGNCSVFPIALFKTLVDLAGTDQYWVFRSVLLVLHLTVVTLVGILTARRIGSIGAAISAVLVLVMGASADNMLWPAQFGYVLSIIGGLIALLLLDHARNVPRATPLYLCAAAALILALGSSSTGVPLWVLATVEIAAQRHLRRQAWWVSLAPLALYGAWALLYGQDQLTTANMAAAPTFAVTMAAAAASGLVGLPSAWGTPILVAGIIALARWFLHGGAVSTRLAGAVLALIALWTLTAFARATIEDPQAPRYIYLAGILFLLIISEVLRGQRLQTTRPLLVAALLLVIAVPLGMQAIDARGKELRNQAAALKARLAAIDLLEPAVAPDFQVSPEQIQVIAGPALSVQHRHGRIAYTTSQLRTATNDARTQADRALLQLAAIHVTSAAPPAPQTADPCTVLRAGIPADLTRSPGQALSVTSTAPSQLQAWRFADGPSTDPPINLPAGGTSITLKGDHDPNDPWHLRITTTTTSKAC